MVVLVEERHDPVPRLPFLHQRADDENGARTVRARDDGEGHGEEVFPLVGKCQCAEIGEWGEMLTRGMIKLRKSREAPLSLTSTSVSPTLGRGAASW